MKLMIVIVNYKVTDLTIECLRSLSPQIASVQGARVTICENGTGEEAAARLRRTIRAEGWQDWAAVTAIHPNRGFTGGNNAILDPLLASTDRPAYFWLLNADTVVCPKAMAALNIQTVGAGFDRPDFGKSDTLQQAPVSAKPRPPHIKSPSLKSPGSANHHLRYASRESFFDQLADLASAGSSTFADRSAWAKIAASAWQVEPFADHVFSWLGEPEF